MSFAGYTMQEAYDIVAAHLGKQKRRCTLRGVVVMRHEHRACPVGKLIPDELYSEDIAHAHAADLPKATIAAILPYTGYTEAVDFLRRLEDVHDEATLAAYGMAMAKELVLIADRFGLDSGAEKKLATIYWKG